jgi:hypothetical protein
MWLKHRPQSASQVLMQLVNQYFRRELFAFSFQQVEKTPSKNPVRAADVLKMRQTGTFPRRHTKFACQDCDLFPPTIP